MVSTSPRGLTPARPANHLGDRPSMRSLCGVSMISVSTPPMSFGWTKKIGVPCAPIRGSPSTLAPFASNRPWLRGYRAPRSKGDAARPPGSWRESRGSASSRPAARSARSGCSACRRNTPSRPARADRTARGSRRPHHVAVEGDGVLDRRSGDSDMVEAAEFHRLLAFHIEQFAQPIMGNLVSRSRTPIRLRPVMIASLAHAAA